MSKEIKGKGMEESTDSLFFFVAETGPARDQDANPDDGE